VFGADVCWCLLLCAGECLCTVNHDFSSIGSYLGVDRCVDIAVLVVGIIGVVFIVCVIIVVVASVLFIVGWCHGCCLLWYGPIEYSLSVVVQCVVEY